MSTFGEELIHAMAEAFAHGNGEAATFVHAQVDPREIRTLANMTQAQMAALMGMNLSGYRKWELGQQRVSGPSVRDREGPQRGSARAGRALRPS